MAGNYNTGKKYGKEMVKLYIKGYSLRELAEKYNVSQKTVQNILHKYGNVSKCLDLRNDIVTKIKELSKTLSDEEIAKQLNLTMKILRRFKYRAYTEKKLIIKVINPCKRCGYDKGVNRWYCDTCLSLISSQVNTFNYIMHY